MRAKKLSLIMAIVILAITMMVMFAGCAVKISVDEAFTAMESAIANSVVQQSYYVKNIKIADGATHDIRLNVHKDDPKTDVVDNMGMFSITTTRGIGSTEEVLEWLYSPMLASSVKKPKKAAVADYQNYLIKYDSKAKTAVRSASTHAEFLEIVDLRNYVVTNVLADLATLQASDLSESAATKLGVVTAFEFNVVKEGHPYNGKTIIAKVMYNKIDSLSINNKDGKKADEYFITYLGPKIKPPRFDGKYRDIQIS